MKLEEHLEKALRDARERNALVINRVRFVGVAAFALVVAILVGSGDAAWKPVFVPLVAYAAVALVLMLGSEANSRVRWIGRLAVPVIDMPMVLAIQWTGIVSSDAPGPISEFSVALFVCLIMLSAFTLHARQITISLVVAILCQQWLQYLAGVSLGGHISSVIVFCLAAWICRFAGHNRLRLVEAVTEGDARRKRLQRYFSPGVGELLEKQDEDALAMGRECELTVIFADIRGFTALSEELDGEEVVRLLNGFHAKMVEAVFQHGGTLDKYLGDGLMAYFNAPVAQTDHADRAVRCALAMGRELAALNTDRSWEGKAEIGVGIGIHSGKAIVGDVGAPHRREFTAIGQAVNIASRIESLTKGLGEHILVSAATVERTSDEFAWCELGGFEVRGCADPVRLYAPGG